ncbi:MAG TPA: hypothetical protein VGN14_16455 [Candidatus Elarobacter sp.]
MLVAVAVIAAFVIGRATSTSPERVAEAQVPSLSHFECYQTTTPTTFKPVTVVLRDQFGPMKTILGRPNMLCAPTRKELIGQAPHKFAGPADHLLCYPEDAAPKAALRHTDNQIGPSIIRNLQPRWLCVPTHKFPK